MNNENDQNVSQRLKAWYTIINENVLRDNIAAAFSSALFEFFESQRFNSWAAPDLKWDNWKQAVDEKANRSRLVS